MRKGEAQPMKPNTTPTPRLTGGELKQIRETLGMSQQALADELGMRRDTLAKMESDHPRYLVPYGVRSDLREVFATQIAAIEALREWV